MLSIARIIVTLGAMLRAATEFVVPGACHFLRRKSLMPSHVSSMLRYTLLLWSRSRAAMTHRYLSIKLRGLLAPIGTYLIFLYLRPLDFRTRRTSASVYLLGSLTSNLTMTALQLSMNASSLISSSIALLIASSFRDQASSF